MDEVVRRLTSVDLNLLVSLHALLRFRSVTAAARHLGLTQSTVSHQLAKLRELLDDPLLIRRGSDMEPTPRATALASRLGRALKDVHDLVFEMPRFEPLAAEGEVVLALTDWASTQYGPPLQAILRAEAPGLVLRVVPALLDHQIDSLDWSVDLAVVSTVEPLPSERAATILHERFVGVARAGHPFVHTPPDLATFIAAKKLLVHSAVVPPQLDAEIERRLHLAEHTKVRVPFFLALPQLLGASDLVSLVPSTMAWSMVVDHGLGAFALPAALPGYTVNLAWSPLRVGDPKIAWLVERIRAFVEATLPERAARYTVP